MLELNRSQTAEAFNVTTPTIDAWVRRGCPHRREGREYCFTLHLVIEWRISELTKKASVEKTPSGLDALGRKTMAEAQIKEMELAALQGLTIPTDQVEKSWERMIADCKKRLLSIPIKTAPLVMACKTIPEAKELLEIHIYEALNELSIINPAQFIDGADHPLLAAAGEADDQPVGRPEKKAQPRSKR